MQQDLQNMIWFSAKFGEVDLQYAGYMDKQLFSEYCKKASIKVYREQIIQGARSNTKLMNIN
jgi:hypothetical protein